MKNHTLILIFSIFLIAACKGTGEKSGITDGDKMVNTEYLRVIEYDVSGMTCTGCESSVISSVNSLDGIQEVKASFLNSSVVVKYDSTLVTDSQIEQAISSRGYPVKGKTIPGSK